MFESRVHRAGKYQIGGTELFDPPESLELRGVEDLHFLTSQLDITMNWIS